MRGISRFSDIGAAVCCCHSCCVGTIGTIIPLQQHTLSDDLNVSRVGDIVIFSCGHIGLIVSGSFISETQNLSTARTGDAIVGCPIGFIITGSRISNTD